MPIYRGVPVDVFIHNINSAESLISGVYDGAMNEESYRREWGAVASYWHQHLHSHSTFVRLLNARHAATPKTAAKAIRESQVEEAFTFFHPYFLSLIEQDEQAAQLHDSLYNAGCFDAISLPAIARTDIRNIIEGHHGYFTNLGMYNEIDIPSALYNAYFICRDDDNIARFAPQANAMPMTPEEEDAENGTTGDDFEGAVNLSTHDGYDYTHSFASPPTEGDDSDEDDDLDNLESWQINLPRRVYPQFQMPQSDRQMLRWLISPVVRRLRQLDEIRVVSHMDFQTGPFITRRPTIVGTEYAATRLAAVLPPRFRVFDAFMQPIPAPN
jgi:hypothetical protein